MIEATDVLDSYLRGIRRLSGAHAASLFVPGVLAGQSDPILLHDGDSPAAEELASLEQARRFASRFEGAATDHGAEAETPRLMASRRGDALLVPLPSLEPIWFWGVELSSHRPEPGGEGRRHRDQKPPPGLPPAAWLALAITPGQTDQGVPPLPKRFPEPAENGSSAWPWLFSLGGAIASHTTQVNAMLLDPITGLPDRIGLQAILGEGLERSHRLSQPLCLLLLNPHDFNAVNDRFGREAGDRIVREIGDRLRGALRKSDVIARFGGVIFAVVLPSTSAERSQRVGLKVLEALEVAPYLNGQVEIRFSIGAAAAAPDAAEPMPPLELIRRADHALSAAKSDSERFVGDWALSPESRPAEAFDRLSGIFTGNMAKDYRNMVLLSDALEVIAEQQDSQGLVTEVVERLFESFRPARIAIFGRSEQSDEMPLLRGLSRLAKGTGGQQRLETVELGNAERELLKLAFAASEPQTRELEHDQAGHVAYAVPLMASGRCLGLLYLEEEGRNRLLEPTDLVFLKALASQLGVAMDRARLSERDQQRQEQEKKQLRAELNDLRQALQHSKMVYRSPQMESVVATARRVAPTDATVLITGESGTGKELLARTVHELSPRRGKPMVVVDCGAIATTLIESELFGHERGAYTGAQQRRVGRLTEADGGTVLLDEIGELPLEVQSKLLRFVQEKQLVTVGGTRPRRVDARIIAATNRDLAAEVAAGRFREDLYHRLNVIRLEIPPLRKRPEDVLHLARHFLEDYSIRYQKSARRLNPEAEARLLRYAWPGNVRELQNRLMQAVILCESEELGTRELNLPESPVAGGAEPMVAGSTPPAAPADRGGDSPEAPATLDEVLERLRQVLARQVEIAMAAGAQAAFPLGKWLGEDLVIEANRLAGDVARRGAAMVGIPETTFRRRLQKSVDQVQAGFSPRTGTWDEVRTLILDLLRVGAAEDQDLLALAERVLLQEILAQAPNDTRSGAKLLGVTPPTFRVRTAQLAEGPESP